MVKEGEEERRRGEGEEVGSKIEGLESQFPV